MTLISSVMSEQVAFFCSVTQRNFWEIWALCASWSWRSLVGFAGWKIDVNVLLNVLFRIIRKKEHRVWKLMRLSKLWSLVFSIKSYSHFCIINCKMTVYNMKKCDTKMICKPNTAVPLSKIPKSRLFQTHNSKQFCITSLKIICVWPQLHQTTSSRKWDCL